MSRIIRAVPTARDRALTLLRTLQFDHSPACPCHFNPNYHRHRAARHVASSALSGHHAHHSHDREYAFQLASSNIRFGAGATREVGMDMKNLNAKKICVVTDGNVGKLPVMETVRAALEENSLVYSVFDQVVVEPKDYSVKAAISFAKKSQPDAFLAVGGGSVIDTAKLMNLYTCHPDAGFLDFVNAPLGRGLLPEKPLRPLVVIPTTAGTGSETTGTAIFDLASAKAKTGISNRALKPLLGICDPENTRTMPASVHVSSGLDVLFHSLESWTAIPYTQRKPRPPNPEMRPAYQGANPISDIFSLHALRETVQYLPRVAKDPSDHEAQEKMLLAATLAGVGFGNAGVHLCHAMSYPISSSNPGNYAHEGYQVSDRPIIPHGVSVAVTAPAVFRFTAVSDPDRHRTAAEAFGVDTHNVSDAAIGDVLADAIKRLLENLGGQPRGIKGLGFKGDEDEIEGLVEGTLPQKRVLSLAPKCFNDDARNAAGAREQLRNLFREATEY